MLEKTPQFPMMLQDMDNILPKIFRIFLPKLVSLYHDREAILQLTPNNQLGI